MKNNRTPYFDRKHLRPIATIRKPSGRPTNCFINWLQAKYENHDIIFNVKYSEEQTVSSFITEVDVNDWNTKEPVFISAQTGKGKNYFIKNILIKDILEHNAKHPTRHKKVLVLSNRIALNRQSKLSLAEIIYKTTGNRNAIEQIENYLTFKGFDKFYMNFDECITVCSYHQLLERKLLDEYHYDYIICDEAHFFVSDSTFNHYTDDMLHYIVTKGINSIRIYMSATLNLAMDPILREEYNIIEQENIKFQEYHNIGDTIQNAFERLVRQNTKIPLNSRIYFMKRDFEFINKIYRFNSIPELAKTINSSKVKWIIFVKSNADGLELQKELKRSNVFISRDRVARDPVIEVEYNKIIENQTFEQDVLICTSLLDNGINILPDSKNREVKNVVIFSLDKTQFLQMLGRVRTSKPKSFNLFLYDYPISYIEFVYKRVLDEIMSRLQCDLWNLEERKKNFTSKYFKFVKDPEVFCDYNDCSLVKLLDIAKTLAELILFNTNSKGSLEEPTLSNTELETAKNKLIFNLKTTWINSYEIGLPIYELFKEPNRCEMDFYDFEHFFYAKILQDYFLHQTTKYFETALNMLNQHDQNVVLREVKERKDIDMPLVQTSLGISIVEEKLKDYGIEINNPVAKHLYGMSTSYINYGDRSVHESSIIEEQVDWIYQIEETYYHGKEVTHISKYKDKDK